jgi:hypothetical protein
MALFKSFFLVITMLILSGTIQAGPEKTNTVITGQSKTTVEESVLTPGSRLYEGDSSKNEFYILGKNDPVPAPIQIQYLILLP